MRLFVALEIPSAVRENLGALLASLRALTREPGWVRAENLHVTLKFLGEVGGEKLDALRAALAEVRSGEPVRLDFHGLGFFPNEKHPRVFWAGIEGSPNLKKLAADIESKMEELGFPCERREFSPHLTLARFERSRLPEALRQPIADHAPRVFGSLQTSEFHLIQSRLQRSGAEYTTLTSFRFVASEGNVA